MKRQRSEEQLQKARDRTRKWRANNPERARSLDKRKYLSSRYGLTVAEYELMHEAQGGRCKLCNSPETIVNGRGRNTSSLAVDHCHETGKIRGLLCFRCNTSIGQIQKYGLADKVSAYLRGDPIK